MKNIKISKKGSLGEEIACRFLESRGHMIIDRNYSKKFGEIDIIASKSETLYFVEVKSTVVVDAHGISREPSHEPEELITGDKIRSIRRVGDHYLASNKKFSRNCIIAISVFLNLRERRARVRMTEVE